MKTAVKRKARRAQKGTRTAKQERSRATVDAILQAGAEILRREGWKGFSTNAVAARAGVSIGSLYEYFKDKQAIVDEIIARHVAEGSKIVQSKMPPPGVVPDPKTIVHIIVRISVETHEEDPMLHAVIAAEVPMSPRNRACNTLIDDAVKLFAGWLQGHVNHPELTARLLIETADAMVHKWSMEPDGTPVSADKLAAELEVMLHAYLITALRGATFGTPTLAR